MDLYTVVAPEDSLHPHFKHILKSIPSNLYARKVIASWAEGFPDRDGKFVYEFQTTFNSSLWELYLHAALRELGAEFNWEHYAPDFTISLLGHQFLLEATTANHLRQHHRQPGVGSNLLSNR
ncbi:hypothetical protein [Pseudomonas typographi]|uniref:Uncharacterized protein n=1 Tax=Pseudomonas typographi TaxID=2715964 RepID=A0ABR7ZAP5_9PSED|nr:hypothetical protein [Pseudomonas typographi]MBD1555242.1 hypothetical protein [Pseudomonas typographi]MBD1590308.1 hypothetical protein [Pseudomonas typographi]MBD1602437.1 hypothetical protein [Pseudomonas typographi]